MKFIVLYGYFPCFESSISGIERTPFTKKWIGQLVLKGIHSHGYTPIRNPPPQALPFPIMYNGTNWLSYFNRSSSIPSDDVYLSEHHPQLIVKDMLEVDSERYGIIERVYVYNSHGDVLLEQECGEELLCKMDVSELPAGIYNLAVMQKKGGIKSRRFLKE